MDQEIWKAIKGFEKCYEVSNFGRIKSLEREIKTKDGRSYIRKEKILSSPVANTGYARVALFNGGKVREADVHRLVAETFLDNPNGYKYVNHLDENKTNNNVSNLEWCTNRHNAIYSNGKKVKRINDKGEVKLYESISSTSDDGFNSSHVGECCNKKRKSHKGYRWEFYLNEA